MQYKLTTILLLLFIFVSCKKEVPNQDSKSTIIKQKPLEYATGFEVEKHIGYTVIHLNTPWPNADKKFTYLLVDRGTKAPKEIKHDALIQVPIEKVVVTSTTHIPLLEALGEEHKLLGFPNTNFVSSEKTRKRIDTGKVVELGKNENLNTELLLDLQPDVIIGFAINGNNKTFKTIQNAGIPVLYNAAWVEKNILGRAEWIKFFGYLFKKEKLANEIFNQITSDYNEAKKLANNVSKKPTVLAGSMFKDIWHVPYGSSWGAQFITDAGGDYLWKDTKGSGSISLNIESVLEKAQQADYWVTLGTETSKEQLSARNVHYKEFEAFQEGNTFIANSTGATGGLLFYELGPNRPDLILKDLIHIFHPNLLPNHQPIFYHQLK